MDTYIIIIMRSLMQTTIRHCAFTRILPQSYSSRIEKYSS